MSIGGNDDGLFATLVGSWWVNGAEPAPDGTIPFHPFAVGEAGMAAVVQELLES